MGDLDRSGARPARHIARGEKIFELVARDIVRQIAAEEMPPGAMLPSEAQMLAQYDVGRASLREALRVLEVHGLISIKPGPRGGPIVSEVNSSDFGRMATLYFQVGGATFRELTEARLVMEPVMARLAAQRRDPEHLADLERVLAEGRAVALAVDDLYLRSSTDFHSVIAGMSGNRILDLFGRALKEIFTDRVSGMLFPASQREQVRLVHEAIAKAIFKGEATRAERLMREHMETFVDYVQQRHPGLMDEVVDWR
ncbi:MAG TPA: FCD domain-containing protein [Candidatus Dormibacteraeota bacterium]|jgi:DNA-binding FadR family transcriptional regulator|nr:FCD domain-containing protein [Candidatus Dormibacteraeota bacterium]